MNAAILGKSAKGLILASGLIAASTVLGYAQDATVPLGAQATIPLSSMYAGAPSGITTLGGHSFDLSGGNLIQLGNGQSVTFNGTWLNATSAYLLLNTANTYLWYDQSVVGNVTITFSDGTTQSTDLIVGSNIREWRIGAGFTDNTITDPATAQVWSGTAVDGTPATIDMLTITLPGTKTATSATLNDTNGFGALNINLAGLTIDPQNPTPAPQPVCTRPGASCSTPAAQNSQAWKFQPQIPGAAATAPTNPHANANSNGHANGNPNGALAHKSQ
jgi:hypothetical protein